MRFRNVDNQKRDLISVLLVELVESGNLPPEGRSGVAYKSNPGPFGVKPEELKNALARVAATPVKQ
jgi:hypothetical protein